jgi:hypothetical protein
MTGYMSPGEALVASVALKNAFYDRHERRAYDRAVMIAKHIVDNPDSIAKASVFLELHVRTDPHQRAAYETWKALLTQESSVIASALLADTEEGAELRNSAPVFVVFADARNSGLILR